MAPADFGNLIANDTDKRAKLIRTANIKAEQAVRRRANSP